MVFLRAETLWAQGTLKTLFFKVPMHIESCIQHIFNDNKAPDKGELYVACNHEKRSP